ncbi:coiled-coil domain-containing protein 172 [Eleutherodactylus coqui]|uniref:coiled-coil domain-containing protein 172 n=1 Tax=Eleutherodactylus coqui TaxID=57060 RepID=UPI003462FDEE
MSVDSLYQQVVLSQQRAQERRRVLQGVRTEVTRCQERIPEVAEKLQAARTAEERTAASLLEKALERDLAKKRLDGLEVQKKELLGVNQDLRCKLQEVKEATAAEEEKFMKEVQDYNNNYGLTVNRKELLRISAKTESQRLEEEAKVLGQDIEALSGENIYLNALHRQRNAIRRELSDFQETLQGLDKEICAAVGITKSLEAEKLAVSQKPQSDAECQRLKKELESYREENMERAYEALRTEVDLLQQKLSEVHPDRPPRPVFP